MVGFKVKFYWYQIGQGDFLHAFFSTVAFNLENKNWGSRFPIIMNELYQGKLNNKNVDKAICELNQIIDDLSKQPPWADKISDSITSLANYFVTSDGEDFLAIFSHALEKEKEIDSDLEVETM